MKAQKIISTITIILLVLIITAISFLGIYKKEEYKVSNLVPDYLLGMEFTESRVVSLEIDKETNSEEILTVDNYKKAKSIIKYRLKKLGVDQYKISLDEATGNLQIRIPENDNTDEVIYYLLQSGTFELKDSSTEEVLMDTSSVKDVDVMYSQGDTQTAVFLQIKFNKEGKQKLEELSKTYVEVAEEETTEDATETEDTIDTEETKSIDLYLNGEAITEFDFSQSVMNGMLYIGLGSGSDTETINQYVELARKNIAILNSGVLPITYTETDYTEIANINKQYIEIAIYVALVFLALMIIVFVITLKTKGLLASILQVGYIALLLLTLRYTNVKITMEGIFGIIIASIINFIYTYKAFKNIDLNFIKDVTAKFALKLIPLYIIAIIFSFNNIANIYSLGMTLVWGTIVMYLYNLSLTQVILKNIRK